MTEKRFLSCLLTEGIFLTLIGISLLLLPKVTPLTIGFISSFAFLSYGGYKSINAWLARNFTGYYLINFISGILLALAGFALLFAPLFNIEHIIAAISVYFVFESIGTSALASRAKNILRFRYFAYILSFIQFIFGFAIISALPAFPLWSVVVLAGTDFILTGVVLLDIYYATVYKY